MDGKPLYEYARANIPLPRAIPTRQVSISIQLLDFTPAATSSSSGHSYRWPETRLSDEDKKVFRRLTELVHDTQASSSSADPPMPEIGAEYPEISQKTGLRPATFHVRMTVSGGTYVRSIVHDLGLKLGCGAHVVMLRRTRQGQFVLRQDGTQGDEDEEEAMVNAPLGPDKGKGKVTTSCIPWTTWESALEQRKAMLEEEAEEKEQALASGTSHREVQEQFSDDALRQRRMKRPEQDWEKEVLKRFVEVPVPGPGEHNWHHRLQADGLR